MKKKVLALIAASLLPVASVVNTMPASAAEPVEMYACEQQSCVGAQVGGHITWNNRTATLDGTIWTDGSDYPYTAHFDAFAGSTLIDSDTRTRRVSDDDPMGFGPFTIGDPNLVGGINRVRVTLCNIHYSPPLCGLQYNFWR